MRKKHGSLYCFLFGGSIYCLLELLWRRRTHPSMFCAGGIAYAILYKLFVKRCRKYPTWEKCMIGSGIITLIEFVTGCLVNLRMKMNVWDYSKLAFNIKGQVCLLYSFFWGLLTLPIVCICNKVKRSRLLWWR